MNRVEYSLLVPPDWTQFELSDDTISDVANQMAHNIVQAVPALADRQSQFRQFWLSQLSHARSVGVRHVASFVEQAADKVLMAFMQIQILLLPPIEGENNALDALYDACNKADDDSVAFPDVAIIRHVNLGKGVQSISREWLHDSDSTNKTEVMMLRTYFPLEDSTFGITFMTPNVDEAEPLMKIFELITSTVEIRVGKEREE